MNVVFGDSVNAVETITEYAVILTAIRALNGVRSIIAILGRSVWKVIVFQKAVVTQAVEAPAVAQTNVILARDDAMVTELRRAEIMTAIPVMNGELNNIALLARSAAVASAPRALMNAVL